MNLKKLQAHLRTAKVGGCLIFSSDSNFFYLCNKRVDNTILFIPSKGRPVIFTNLLEQITADFLVIHSRRPFFEFKRFIKMRKIKIIGINESSVSVKQNKSIKKFVKTVDLEETLSNLRKIKTGEEIARIRAACLLSEKILRKIVEHFNFKHEKEIKDFIKIEALRLGCELSFEPIVASGRNASIPHYSGTSKLRRGFLVLDFGLKYKGYCADITRTFFLGEPAKKEIDEYNFLLTVQKKVIEKVKSGITTRELEFFARSQLGVKQKEFIHSLGHGIGIEIHEAPTVSLASLERLRPGMVITIEPGIYSESGIRLEDDLVVTSSGSILLSKFSKQLIIIPKV